MSVNGGDSGFGTLNERTLHSAVKAYIEPDRAFREVAFGGFIADILRDGAITEVQTGSVTPLVKKLLRLPPEVPVTIALPIVREKTICMIDENGELISRRRSPKKSSFAESFYQLPRLLPLAGRDQLWLRLILLDADEYRSTLPVQRIGRRDCRRIDRIPTRIVEDRTLAFPGELAGLLPGLPPVFTREELKRATRLSDRGMSGGLSALIKLGVVEQAGKDGRKNLYRIVDRRE